LGQNVLDIIESRRNLIEVVGTNSIAQNPRIFRCDTVYFVHETKEKEFESEFTEIVSKENPDLILPGRDEDCIFLADFKTRHHEEFKNKIPLGDSLIPEMMLDKQKSFLFCRENGLPFADTFYYSSQRNRVDLNDFISEHGFPLLVKPREGFASVGVYYVITEKQVDEITESGDVLFQEYLGNPEHVLKFKDIFKRGIPLFFQVPEKEQYAAQTIIGPDGKIGEVFFTINTMVHGRAEFSKQIFDDKVENLVKTCSSVFFQNGWYGPVNFQLKPDRSGNWKIFELNPRLTGTSSGRTLLGYDEFGILCDIFIPEMKIPSLTKSVKTKGILIKYLTDNLLLDKDVERLKADKVWKRS